MFREIILTILLVLLSFYLMKNVKNIIRRNYLLFKLPAPKWLPLLGHLTEVLCDEGTVFKKLREWSKEYGPFYMLYGLHVFITNISGPEEFEIFSSSMKHSQKGQLYCFLHNWLGSGLLTSAGSQWATRRKILTPAFHFRILQDFISVFNEKTDKLVEILKQNVGKPVNVVPLISHCTLGAIVETAMGCKLDLQDESDYNYVQAIYKIGKIPFYRLVRPWFRQNIIFHHFSQQGRLEKRLLKIINKFTDKIIKKKEENFEKIDDVILDDSDEKKLYFSKKKLVMLDVLLNAKVSNGIIDDEGIKDEVNTIMFEGHDTTATAICFTLLLLAYHRNIQDLVYEEIIQNLQDNQKQFSWSGLNDLKYMECVIKEVLRLYPSVPVITRTVEEDITTKNGYTIPKGAESFVHIFDIHRNPKYWPEPDKFDPDRFLPENCVNRHPFAYVPFSAGPRNCIGQKFALLEIKAVLSGILQNFILEPIDTPATIVLVPDIVLRTDNGSLLVKFINRK